MTRYAIIVDPLSTGQEYGQAFADAGVTPVAVLSGAEQVPFFSASWHPEKYDIVHRLADGDLDTLAATLRGYAPLCIVPGAEAGVPLYEALVPLVLPGTGNVAGLGHARRDKWAMAQAVAAAGVPVLRQIFSRDEAEIGKWIADEGLCDHDLVVKPVNSCGADDVHIVPAGGDWRALVGPMSERVNASGLLNGGVLVQEFAQGHEFLVDTYSVDGRHGLVDVCRYTKFRNGDQIGLYDRVDFLDPAHPDVAAVWPYTQQVLEALGFRNGCGHAEIMMTPDGPRLIEVAERPAGGGHQLISRLATGDNHIMRTVAHRVHDEFRPGYQLDQHVRGVFISARRGGVWRNGDLFAGVDGLPTFWAKNFPFGTGDQVRRTVDIASYLAWVVLAGQDEDQIDEDYRVIKELEGQLDIQENP